MEQTMVVVLGMMILFLIVAVGLLIATGVVIYKDAKAHEMKAWLWTMIALFVPNFIGIVIYLIVRHGVERQYHCSNCGVEVKGDYNICPNCQGVFEKICNVCKHAVKSNMAYCPYCGNKVEEIESTTTATKVVKKTNIVKPLAIIGGSYVAMFLIVMITMFTMAFISGEFMTETSVMEMEMNTLSKMESSFKYKNGKEDMRFKLDEGEVQPIEIEIELTTGSIELIVTEPNGEIIYEKRYEQGNYEEVLDVHGTTKGKYKVNLKVDEASGRYKISKVK